MIIDKSKLDSLVDEGWLTVRDFQLSISPYSLHKYCYSRQTEYENHWTDETIMCRGLIIDDDGKVVFNCIPKFFNLGQENGYYNSNDDESVRRYANSYFNEKEKETLEYTGILSGDFYEKLDGTMIQIVNHSKYGMLITTKNSFDNEYTNKAREIIEKERYTFRKDWCYTFELIYPQNRIVVDYGNEEKLVLLSVRTLDGHEKDIDFKTGQFEKVKMIEDVPLYLSQSNIEGLVFKSRNRKPTWRCKIKTEEYLKLHRLRTECTPKRVWEILKEGKRLCDYDLPDEFIEDLLTVQTDLLDHYHAWHEFAREQAHKCIVIEEMTKKDIAMCGRYDNFEKALIFGVLDRKNIDELIWRKIKPKGELND